jgi:malate dehydrogenase
MNRLDQNRAQAQIAARMGVGVDCVRNVIIWGNHSSTQYPDARFAVVRKGAEETKLVDNMPDTTWLQDQFITVNCFHHAFVALINALFSIYFV